MGLSIKKIPYEKIEFQMFVIDELCDDFERKGRDIIKLTIGNSELPLSDQIKEVLVEKIFNQKDSHLVYPQGLPLLRERIAEYYQAKHIKVKKENIVIGTGTSSLIKDLLRILINKSNEEVLLPKPFYSSYLFSALFAGATIRYYDIDLKSKKINIESFKKNYAHDRTKIVFLCSPGNPLGNVILKKEYEEILKIVEHNSFILSDEIYANVAFGEAPVRILTLADNWENIIVSNSFSKGYRMYTKRVGFFIIPDKLAFPFRVLQQHGLLTVDPINQFGCIAALQAEDEINELTELYWKRRDYTIEQLKDVDDIDLIIPDGGFYFTIDCRKFINKKTIKNSLHLSKDILNKTGVGVVPGSDFGIEGTIRLAYTNSRYNEGIDRLKKYFTWI